jgi:uncharacterized protein (TIGR02217 family)
MDYDDVRLPVDVERGARGGPGFKTTIVTSATGSEQRNSEWSRSRATYDIGYGINNRTRLGDVYDFFLARRGRARAFRFKDWIDFEAVAEPVGTTGNPLTRQLQITYPDTVNAYVREIIMPVVSTLIVYVNNFVVATPAIYTLGADGVLTFGSDPGVNVKATFEFDVPVRFDTDDLSVTLNTYTEGEITSIPIVEVK